MNSTLKASMALIMEKYLLEFRNDPNSSDLGTIQHYAMKFADDYERYLKAYRDFKEEK